MNRERRVQEATPDFQVTHKTISSRVKYSPIRRNAVSLHAEHDQVRHFWITDDEHSFSIALSRQLVHALYNRPAALSARIPYHSSRIGLLYSIDNSIAVVLPRVTSGPVYSRRCDIGVQKTQTRADARACCDKNDFLEETGCIEQSVQGAPTDPDLALASSHDLLVRPVASVADHDAEAGRFIRCFVDIGKWSRRRAIRGVGGRRA
jgi:hypothetical protein